MWNDGEVNPNLICEEKQKQRRKRQRRIRRRKSLYLFERHIVLHQRRNNETPAEPGTDELLGVKKIDRKSNVDL